MSATEKTWTRISDSAGDGYQRGNVKIWDNGKGFGSVRGSGRWAVEINGYWVANIDTLSEAKSYVGTKEA
jgi:hypothetical protein